MKKSSKQAISKQEKKGEKSSVEDALSTIDLSTLRTCLSIYNDIKSKGPRYLSEFEQELGVDGATIHRRVTRLEQAMAELIGKEDSKEETMPIVKFQLFERQRGAKAKIPEDDWLRKEVESIFFNISEIVGVWERLTHRWGAGEVVIRLATTLSAARFIVPNLLRTPELKDVWFDVTQTKSSRLLEMARKNSRDLILTEVPRDFPSAYNAIVYPFGLSLIAPRGHWIEREPHIATLDIRDILNRLADSGTSLCLLPEDPTLYPLPDYPDISQFPKHLRLLRAGSTTLCQSLVMNSRIDKSVVAITGTQFLTEDDLERLVTIPLQREPTYMALIRPKKPTSDSRSGLNLSRTDAIDAAEMAIRNLLEKAKEQSACSQGSVDYSMFHTTVIGNKNVWAKGKLSWRSRSPTGDSPDKSNVTVLTGTHSVQGACDGLCYIVRGRAVQNKFDTHVTYRARSIGGNGEDAYVFSGFGSLQAGEIRGVWNGVLSQADKPKGQKWFLPGAGFAVITEEEEVDIKYLNNCAEEYRSKYQGASQVIFHAENFAEPEIAIAQSADASLASRRSKP